MLDPQNIKIGDRYRNIKTRDIYEVVLISRSSEDSSRIKISYSKPSDDLPWTRSQSTFVVKFEEIVDVQA